MYKRQVNTLSALLVLAGSLFYIIVYTLWLKKVTPENIVIGGAAGAIAPLVGWTSVTASVDWPAVYMFGIVFLWTPPHFWSLTLSKRRDYGEAGVPMLPVVKGEDITRNHIAGYTVILIITSLMMVTIGNAGLFFLATGMLLSAYFCYLAFSLKSSKSEDDAWDLFKFSNIYLYTLFISLVIDTAYRISLG